MKLQWLAAMLQGSEFSLHSELTGALTAHLLEEGMMAVWSSKKLRPLGVTACPIYVVSASHL